MKEVVLLKMKTVTFGAVKRQQIIFIANLFILGFAIRWITIVRLEEDVIDFIRAQAIRDEQHDSRLEEAIALVNAIGKFCVPRREFADQYVQRTTDLLLSESPIIASLAFGGGACGYATEIGVRVFEKEGFKTRFVQVLDSKENTRHVVMEINLQGQGQVIIDPIFGYIFLDDEGAPLSAFDLKETWSEARLLLPDNKIRDYSYVHGVRYSNWGKNAMTRAIYQVFDHSLWDVDAISLRIHYNRIRRIVPYMLIVLSLMIAVRTWWQLGRQNS